MDLKSFTVAVSQLAEEKEIPKNKVVEIIEYALAAAYKKEYGEKGQIVRAKMDQKSGDVAFFQIKTVVDDSMLLTEEEIEERKDIKDLMENPEEPRRFRFNPERHLFVEEAEEIKKGAELGEEIEIPLAVKSDYGRIAAQTAKQVILQKIKEVERETVLDEYKNKEGEIFPGIVQRIEGFNVFVDIGKTLGVISREEQVPRENYKIGQRLKVLVLRVEETSKGPVVFLSRACSELVVKLFELEAPEVSAGSVKIKAIAREAGSRSKIAVWSEEDGLDAIGAVVGQKGTRVVAVISELNGEKIDVIEYSDDPEKFIANALSPAKVIEIKFTEANRALAVVPDDQLSLAIGKDGQNVRLAAKLTGYKIDVKGIDGSEIEEPSNENEEQEETEKTLEQEE